MAPKIANKKAAAAAKAQVESELVAEKPIVNEPETEPVVSSESDPETETEPETEPEPDVVSNTDDSSEAGSDKKVKKERNVVGLPGNLIKHMKANMPSDLAKKLTNKDLEALTQAFADGIIKLVMGGENVTFTHKMTFKRTLRDDRKCKNMKTNEEFTKPSHYVFSMDVMPKLKHSFEEMAVAGNDSQKLKEKKEKKAQKAAEREAKKNSNAE